MRRCDPGTQCSVHRVNVKDAHFGARVLKRRPPGEGGRAKPKRDLTFSGGKSGQNELKILQKILTPWPTISTGIYSPGSSGTMHKHSETLCLG